MDTHGEFQESVSHSCSEDINIKYNTSVFECNICFELAQDPVVTLCGHLFCWPCMYKWLQFHSYSHECPVCKSLVNNDNLVPIYGRGTSGSNLRAHSVSIDDIPSRPASQRPQTARAPVLTYFRQDGSGAPRGFVPMATDLSRTAFFSAISSFLNFWVVDFFEMSAYGATSGGHYMLTSYAHGFHQYPTHVEGTKFVFLTICFLFLGLLVVLMVISISLIWS